MIIKCKNQKELDRALATQGDPEIWLVGSSEFEICGSSQVRACDSSQVTASHQVAVTKKSVNVKVYGGVVIHYQQPQTIEDWFNEYGVKPKRGMVTLYKAVDEDYISSHNFKYMPGTTPVADDWDNGQRECGGGPHFCAFPFIALQFKEDAAKFVACPVKIQDIAFHSDAMYPMKVKARGCCAPVYECDIDGDRKQGIR